MEALWKPQVMVAIVALLIMGVLGLLYAPDHIEVIGASSITGITALGMKLLGGK